MTSANDNSIDNATILAALCAHVSSLEGETITPANLFNANELVMYVLDELALGHSLHTAVINTCN